MGLNQAQTLLLLGGSFDPVHNGHLTAIQYLLNHLSNYLAIDCLHLIPSGQIAHKHPPIASAADRIAMLELALLEIKSSCATIIDPYETQISTISYSVNTLRYLRTRYGANASLLWVIGADQWSALNHWHQWQDLFELTHIIVLNRPGYLLAPNSWDDALRQEYFARGITDFAMFRQKPSGYIGFYKELALDISSTQIRQLLQTKQNQAALLEVIPQSVLRYIEKQNLYSLKPYGP